jgi:guanylate kinase
MQPKNLFLIDGAAGAGKSDLIEYVYRTIKDKKSSILDKYTTRTIRKIEKQKEDEDKIILDLQFVSNEGFEKLKKNQEFYHYTYPRIMGNQYGFSRASLIQALEEVDNVFLIIRSASVIEHIIKDFPEINVIPIFIYTIESKVAERLKKDGYNKIEIAYRLSRTKDAMDDYYNKPTLYKHVIINNSVKPVYQQHLNEVFKLYARTGINMLRISAMECYSLPRAIRTHKDTMLKMLATYDYRNNIFVMMDFDSKNDNIYNTIKSAINSHGYNCIRADKEGWASLTNDEMTNPYAVLYCCKYGIALFDKPPKGRYALNVNVATN